MAESLAEQRLATERQAEERLALERELRHSERLASVGRLAAGVAHEMGAPLNVIKGRVEMLREHPDAPAEKRARNLDIIGAQADVIADIVRQLLTLARPFRLRREAI
jgi:signal transduction histidine kinase